MFSSRPMAARAVSYTHLDVYKRQEEDSAKYFMVSLFLQQIYREMLSIADEHGGKLPNRVVIFGDVYKRQLKKLHLKCVDEVKRINGAVEFEGAYKYQKREV